MELPNRRAISAGLPPSVSQDVPTVCLGEYGTQSGLLQTLLHASAGTAAFMRPHDRERPAPAITYFS